jgi:hypothetical protein
VLKLKPDNLKMETKNLMQHSQVKMMNAALTDDLYMSAQEGHYLNDGGKIDPDFIDNMPDKQWNQLVDMFFPYEHEL